MVPKALAQVCRGCTHIHVGGRMQLSGTRCAAAAPLLGPLQNSEQLLPSRWPRRAAIIHLARPANKWSWCIAVWINSSVTISGFRLREEMDELCDLMGFFQAGGILSGWREKLFRTYIHALFSSFQKAWMAPRHFLDVRYSFPNMDITMTRASKSFADNYLVSVILVTKK